MARSRRHRVLRENKVIIALVILLAVMLSYILYTECSRFVYQETLKAMSAGYRQGVFDTVTRLYEETDRCQPVPVFLGNRTRYVIDAACVQTPAANRTWR